MKVCGGKDTASNFGRTGKVAPDLSPHVWKGFDFLLFAMRMEDPP